MTALLETRALSKNFGALRATRDVTFTLEEGARHALIGPNGAGKTTFINLLTGVLTPSAGEVLFKGTRHHQGRAGRAGQARHRPHLPDQPAVPRPVGAGERLHGDRRARRRGAEHGHAGRLAPRRDRRGDGAADAAQACRHRAQDHSGTALRPPAAGRACHHARAQARGAAARRARRRRAERREPHHPRRHRRAAEEHRRADHRPRHGPGVPLRARRSPCWCAARCSPKARRRRSAPTPTSARSISGRRRMAERPCASALSNSGRVGRLRRDRGAGGHQPRARARREHQRDRAERRRQDHAARRPSWATPPCTRARCCSSGRSLNRVPVYRRARGGHRLRAAGARDFPLAQRAGESRRRRAARPMDQGAGVRAVPEPQGAARQPRQPAFRRRAADAVDRARAADQSDRCC